LRRIEFIFIRPQENERKRIEIKSIETTTPK